jgi:hypothetical protein
VILGPGVRRNDAYTGSAMEYFTWLSVIVGFMAQALILELNHRQDHTPKLTQKYG